MTRVKNVLIIGFLKSCFVKTSIGIQITNPFIRILKSEVGPERLRLI